MRATIEKKESYMDEVMSMKKIEDIFSDGTFVSIYQNSDKSMVIVIDSCGDNLIVIN